MKLFYKAFVIVVELKFSGLTVKRNIYEKLQPL